MKTKVIIKQKPNPKILEKALMNSLQRLRNRLEAEMINYVEKK